MVGFWKGFGGVGGGREAGQGTRSRGAFVLPRYCPAALDCSGWCTCLETQARLLAIAPDVESNSLTRAKFDLWCIERSKRVVGEGAGVM